MFLITLLVPRHFRYEKFRASILVFGIVCLLTAGLGSFILGPILYYEWKRQYQDALDLPILPNHVPPANLERISAEDQSDAPDIPMPPPDVETPQEDSLPSVSSSIDSMEAKIRDQGSPPPVSRGQTQFQPESPGPTPRSMYTSSQTSDHGRPSLSPTLRRNELPLYQASVGICFIPFLPFLELDRILRNYIIIPILGRGTRRDTYVGHPSPEPPLGRSTLRPSAPAHAASKPSVSRPRVSQVKVEGRRI